MPRYVAFLKAINVGGHVVKMDRLRRLFEAEGLENVETFIASGNVIFDAAARNGAALEPKIAARLRRGLGYDVATYVRTTAEVAAIAGHEVRGGDAKGALLLVGFLAKAPSAAATKIVTALSTGTDRFEVHGRELYWLCRGGRMSDSDFSYATLEKAVGQEASFRNMTTVRKLAAKYPAQ